MDTYIVKWNVFKEVLMSSKSFHCLAMEGEIVYCLSWGSIYLNGGEVTLKLQTQCTHHSDFSGVCQVTLSLCQGFFILSHEHNNHSWSWEEQVWAREGVGEGMRSHQCSGGRSYF